MAPPTVTRMAWSTRTAEKLGACPVGPASESPNEAEAELLAATSGRGAPVLDDVIWGRAAAKDAASSSPEMLPDDEATLFALSPAGPLYLTASGALIHDEEGIVASNWRAEVERCAWREGPWFHVSLVLYPPVATHVSSALGLPWREEASDEAGLTYANDRGLVVEEDRRCRVWLASRRELLTVLGVASDHGALVEIRSRVPLEDGSPPPRPASPPHYLHERGEVATKIWVEGDAVHRRVERQGRTMDAQWVGHAGQRVQASVAASSVLPASMSPRAHLALDHMGARFDPGLTASLEQTHAELEQRALEVHPALLQFESAVGGVLVPHPYDPGLVGDLHLGLLQLLWAPAAVRRRMRGDGEEEPTLAPTKWPQMAFGSELLTLVGLQHQEERLYCDRSGAIYRYAGEYDLFRAEAGSIDRWLATAGLRVEVESINPNSAWLRVGGAAAAALAANLGLSRVDDASDQVVTHYVGGGTWVWQQHAFAPNAAATFVVVPEDETAVTLARQLLATPGSDGKLFAQVAGRGGAARFRALQAAGLPVVAG